MYLGLFHYIGILSGSEGKPKIQMCGEGSAIKIIHEGRGVPPRTKYVGAVPEKKYGNV